jgi:hypothetical protein
MQEQSISIPKPTSATTPLSTRETQEPNEQ